MHPPLFRILANKFPQEPNRALDFAAGTGEPPVPLEVLRADLPAALCSVVMRTLARDREQRPAIGALAEALRPYGKGRGIVRIGSDPGAVPSSLPPPPSTEVSRSADGADPMTNDNATEPTTEGRRAPLVGHETARYGGPARRLPPQRRDGSNGGAL